MNMKIILMAGLILTGLVAGGFISAAHTTQQTSYMHFETQQINSSQVISSQTNGTSTAKHQKQPQKATHKQVNKTKTVEQQNKQGTEQVDEDAAYCDGAAAGYEAITNNDKNPVWNNYTNNTDPEYDSNFAEGFNSQIEYSEVI